MKLAWLGILTSVLLASCSSYSGDFRAATNVFNQFTKPASTPSGPWKGTWKSEINGHHGPLWCMVSQDEKNPALWNFRYRAGWGILKFGDYNHQIPATLKRNGNLPLKGTMTLPNNFGTYAMDGDANPVKFGVRYRGNGDKGTMTLTRPGN
jgi:hypothetical protein|tara:strand:+ start:1109 stop:1561 length:453 start_codon:yes stop_codon:yes gene_type:complete